MIERIQGLAVDLAQWRWPELIACERRNDRGLDAYANLPAAPQFIGFGASGIRGRITVLIGS